MDTGDTITSYKYYLLVLIDRDVRSIWNIVEISKADFGAIVNPFFFVGTFMSFSLIDCA